MEKRLFPCIVLGIRKEFLPLVDKTNLVATPHISSKSNSRGLLQTMCPIITRRAHGVPDLVKMFFLRNLITTLASLVGAAFPSFYLET